MTYSYWICDTQTGRKRRLVRPVSPRADRLLNGAGQGSHSFMLRGGKTSRAQNQDLFAEWRSTLVVCWDGRPVWAGLITSSEYEPASGKLLVSTAEIRTILTRRFPFGIGSYEVGTKIFTSRSLRGIVCQLVFYGTGSHLSAAWDLPVVQEMLDETGGESRSYFNYEFHTIESAISELQDAENGPDIDFLPRWSSAGTLEWLLRVGSAGQPRLTGPTFDFNMASARPGALNVKLKSDGADMVTGVFTVGKGSEADMRHGEAATVAVPGGVPSLDVTRQYKEIDDVAVLNGHSNAEVAALQRPTKQWNLDVLAARVLPTIVPGSTIRLYFKGDEFINDGWQSLWALGYSLSGSQTVTLKVQEA